MDHHIQGSGKFFSLAAALLALLLLPLLPSCAQNSPDVRQGEMTVVFEYADDTGFPSARLCAFIESDCDSRRSGMIELSSMKDGFIWNADSLVRLKSGESYWTGYPSFVMQENAPFPLDSYKIIIQNADEKRAEQTLDLDYDTSFYSMTAGEAEERLLEIGAAKKIAIYDEQTQLLYYGEEGDKFSSSRRIWSVFPKASFFNEIWQSDDNSLLCIMPRRLVVPDENN